MPNAHSSSTHRALPSLILSFALLLPALASAQTDDRAGQPRPATCEEAMNASTAQAEPALALWDRCLAEPTLRAEDRAVALCNRGVMLARLNRLVEGLEQHDQCLSLAPRYTHGLATRFMIQHRLGHSAQALRDISAAIYLEPENLDYRRLRAQFACDLNLCERGLNDLDVLVRLSSDKADAYHVRGWALAQAGQIHRGLLDLDEAAKLAPENGRIRMDRGLVLIQLGQGKEALAETEAAVRLLPGDGEALSARGTAREHVGLWATAQEDHRAVLTLAPERAGALNNLAWFYATCPEEILRNPSESLRLAQASVAKTRKAYNLDTLAAALARNGEFSQAAEVQEEVLALLQKQSNETRLREGRMRLALYAAGQAYTQPMAGRAARP